MISRILEFEPKFALLLAWTPGKDERKFKHTTQTFVAKLCSLSDSMPRATSSLGAAEGLCLGFEKGLLRKQPFQGL